MYSRDSITHHQFISNKRSADFELEGSISLVDGPALTADELIKELFKSDVVKQKLDKNSSNNKEANTQVLSKRPTLSLKDVAQKVSSRKIWQALVDTEDEVLPKVSIARPPELLNKNEVIIRFIKGNQGVDFDLTQERVHVKLDTGTKVIPIGRLSMLLLHAAWKKDELDSDGYSEFNTEKTENLRNPMESCSP